MRTFLRAHGRPARLTLVVALIGAVMGAGPILPWRARAAGVSVGVTSSGSSSSRSSITLARPAGTQPGDVMVASIVVNDDDVITAPAGWALVRQDRIVDVIRQALYVRAATASEPASFQWALPGSRRAAGGITTYSGVDPVNPVDVHDAQVQATATTAVTAPSVTTTVPDTLLVHFAAVNAEGTLTPPAGMAERWEAASPNSSNTRDALASSSDVLHSPAGPTGARTATASAAGRGIGAVLALRPAVTGPPDTTAPETTISSGPSGTVDSNSATFTFSSSEAGSTFSASSTVPGSRPALRLPSTRV